MSRTLACAAVILLCAAAPATAALPPRGAFVPDRSLGGIRLGETPVQVRAALGSSFGVCRGCVRTTWYFTYRAFDQHGLAVELSAGHVSAVYTLWQPVGWHAPRGLQLGAPQGQILALAGTLLPIACSGYQALVRDSSTARTVYYVFDAKLWGFGLLLPSENPCR
jgi:hypothetical protein